MDEQQSTTELTDIQKLQQQAEQHLDGWKRAKADYLNLKKQTDKEKEDIAQFAQATAIMQFLPVYDNLKRATSHIPADQLKQDWVQGVVHIQKQFEDVMKQIGIEPIATVGQAFDPKLHHAVTQVKQDGAASGSIVEELGSGFTIHGRVIEPAKVSVAE